MGRQVATLLYPAIAALLGVGGAAVAVWRGVDAAGGVAIGLALFAALLAARNWRMAELERPLLADELMGLHDAVDALRDDAVSSRDRMKELAEVLEEAVAAGRVAVETGQTNGASAAFAGVAGFRATRALEARIARLESALEQIDTRLVSVADAIETALSRADDAVDMDDADDPDDDIDLDRAIEGVNQTAVLRNSRAAAAQISRPRIVADDDPLEDDALEQDRPDEARRPQQGLISPRATTGRAARSPDPDDDGRDDDGRDDDGRDDGRQDDRLAARDDDGDDWDADDAAPVDVSGARDAARAEAGARAGTGHEDARPAEAAVRTVAAPPAPPSRSVRFTAAMADAPFDLSLQPIISLADREPRYFEAMFSEGADPAASLVKAAAVARRLATAGQETPVLCLASMAALRDGETLKGFLDFAAQWSDLPDALRLEFLQSEIDVEDPRDLAALQQLRTRGFVFSVGRVTDLSMDIARLARAGFRTVKLDVGLVFSREQSEAAQNAVVRRLVGALDRAGLELVLENLDTVDIVRRAREAGARLGQGEAIAPPRLAAVEGSWLLDDAAAAPTAEREAEPV